MIRSLAMLVAAISSATLVLPLLAFGQAKDSQQPGANASSGASHSDASHSEAARQLRSFFEADWRRWMTEYPENATHVGFPGQDDRWTDDSPAGIAGRRNNQIGRAACQER